MDTKYYKVDTKAEKILWYTIFRQNPHWYDYSCGLLLRNIINLFMLVVNQFYYNSLRMKFIHVFTYSKTCIAESYTYRWLSTNLSNEQRRSDFTWYWHKPVHQFIECPKWTNFNILCRLKERENSHIRVVHMY